MKSSDRSSYPAPQNYLHTDEVTDVLCSLRLMRATLQEVKKDPHLWKWVILSLHSALQGAMVCHLTGTAGLGALERGNAKKWMEWHDRDSQGKIEWVELPSDESGLPSQTVKNDEDKPPRSYLANPAELFRRLYEWDQRIEQAGEVIVVTDDETAAFELLCQLRKQFTHFRPTSWSIELAGLFPMISTLLGLLTKIKSDPWPFRHAEDGQVDELDKLLTGLRHKAISVRRNNQDAE